MNYEPSTHTQKSFLDTLHPKTAFIGGFITAILTLGTLGFLVLGGCLLSGQCGNLSALASGSKDYVVNDPDAAAAAEAPSVPAAAPTTVPAVTGDDHIRGDKNAKVTIIEYSDFECPFCSKFHPTMQQIMKDYQGKVRWVYRHFPLSFHKNSESAANAAECAGEQNKFWEYGDKLIENNTSLSPDLYKRLASELGLNTKKFEDCLNSGKYLEKIRAQAQAGASAGVTGTPGSFVIGQDGQAIPIKGALPLDTVKDAIDSLL